MRSNSVCLVSFALIASCSRVSESEVSPTDGGSDARVSLGSPQPAGWNAELSVADAPDTNGDPHIVEVSIEAKVATVALASGANVEMWTFNGQLPGPTIRATRGDRVIVHFKNSLPEATMLHWHGVRVDNAMDGNPMVQAPIESGSSFDYSFVVPDEGTYWYHPHVNSSAQVGYGLYGAFIVEPEQKPELGDELLMVLSDVSREEDAGALRPGDYQGWFGDYFGREGFDHLVNGRLLPRLRARAGAPQHWRVINASRAHYATVDLSAFDAQRVAGDGGRSTHPVAISELTLVPGERAELFLVPKGEPASSVRIHTKSFDRFHIGAAGTLSALLDLELTNEPAWTEGPALPTAWPTIPALSKEGTAVRKIEFSEVEKDGVTHFGINGKTGADVDMMTSLANSVETWEISNTTSQDHPFHLHGFSFQVLDVNGAPWPTLEWKDTLNVPAKKKARVLVSFDDRKGHWMFHCHILDHAETGMMATLMVQ